MCYGKWATKLNSNHMDNMKFDASVRYQVAFYENDSGKMLGGFDIERADIETALPEFCDYIEVNGTHYEVDGITKKYRTENGIVVFCVELTAQETE